MKQWICVLFICLSSFGWTQKNTRILFILDASNSMNVDWNNNQTRMEAAKEVLIQEVEKLRGIPNLEIALRVYGHQTPVTNTYQDCNDTKPRLVKYKIFASGKWINLPLKSNRWIMGWSNDAKFRLN